MFVIIGLGNPGEKFEKTRHNVGFMAVDFIAEKNGFSRFEMQKNYDSFISENNEIMLVKPQTFMNESGKTIKKMIQDSRFKIQDIIVIHDDIDLPLGKLKISKDSGAGGHKGIESMINNLGTKDFVRFKIGICPEKGKPKSVESFVIKSFTKEEQEIIGAAVVKTSDALDLFVKEGLEKTMNQYNG